jgi:tRNA(Arg) A34 adenosine deaminase TadA
VDLSRRLALLNAAQAFILLAGARNAVAANSAVAPERRWYDAAAAMKRLAESWGDQPYGAVLVLDDKIVGEGPSRVIRNNDPTAHAEREAIRDAQARLGRSDLSGSVLYSTSRPCAACEAAAARADVLRMVHGAELNDAGQPKP